MPHLLDLHKQDHKTDLGEAYSWKCTGMSQWTALPVLDGDNPAAPGPATEGHGLPSHLKTLALVKGLPRDTRTWNYSKICELAQDNKAIMI